MISGTPKISIIVPVYKVEEYLPCCIESILAQTYTDFELLLIDDGSPDNCGKICDEYAAKDPRIRVFHKENGGVSSARNLGLDHAKGEIVSFVDSDDWVSSTYCETIISNMGNTEILFFPLTYHYEDGCIMIRTAGGREVVGKENVEKEISHMHPYNNTLGEWFFVYACNKAFLRHIIEENHVRFVDSLWVAEDQVFAYTYCQYVEKLKYIEANIYHYRLIYSGLTHKRKPTDQLLLHYNCMKQLVGQYSNPRLIHSINKQLASITLVAALFASSSFRLKIKVLLMLRKHCRATQVEFPYKEIIKKSIREILLPTK